VETLVRNSDSFHFRETVSGSCREAKQSYRDNKHVLEEEANPRGRQVEVSFHVICE
jgi:hypothetical protein